LSEKETKPKGPKGTNRAGKKKLSKSQGKATNKKKKWSPRPELGANPPPRKIKSRGKGLGHHHVGGSKIKC